MVYAILLVMAGAALSAVLLPFLRGQDEPWAETAEERRLRDLTVEKEEMIKGIRELDFDYRSGNLSEQDWRQLRANYEARAAALMQEIDLLQPAPKAGKPE